MLLLTTATGAPARADAVAVFGSNSIVTYLNTLPGITAQLVTEANILSASFQTDYQAFVYTRNGTSFGTPGLSAAAADVVRNYVGADGNVVLFNGDFADILPGHAPTAALFANAVGFATGGVRRGFIGEFNGAAAGLTANGNGIVPLGFIPGSASSLTGGPADFAINLDPAGVGHAVTAGVTFPIPNPGGLEFGSTYSGVDQSFVLARYTNGNPAILARGAGVAATPEPGSLAFFSAAGGVLFVLRRRRSQVESHS